MSIEESLVPEELKDVTIEPRIDNSAFKDHPQGDASVSINESVKEETNVNSKLTPAFFSKIETLVHP